VRVVGIAIDLLMKVQKSAPNFSVIEICEF